MPEDYREDVQSPFKRKIKFFTAREVDDSRFSKTQQLSNSKRKKQGCSIESPGQDNGESEDTAILVDDDSKDFNDRNDLAIKSAEDAGANNISGSLGELV